MGGPVLFDLAGSAPLAVRGACAALWAELEAGDWQSRDEVAARFPLSAWDRDKLIVALDERRCAVVTFNYRLGIALIETAGLRQALSEPVVPLHRRARS